MRTPCSAFVTTTSSTEPVPSLKIHLKSEKLKVEWMDADTSVVKKKHELNPMAEEEESMEW